MIIPTVVFLSFVSKTNQAIINFKYYNNYLFYSTKEVILWEGFGNAYLQVLSSANIW